MMKISRKRKIKKKKIKWNILFESRKENMKNKSGLLLKEKKELTKK